MPEYCVDTKGMMAAANVELAGMLILDMVNPFVIGVKVALLVVIVGLEPFNRYVNPTACWNPALLNVIVPEEIGDAVGFTIRIVFCFAV